MLLKLPKVAWITFFVGLVVFAVLGYFVGLPLINRYLDSTDKNDVQVAFSEYKKEIRLLLNNQNTQSFDQIKKEISVNTSLAKFTHPKTNNRYELRQIDSGSFISGPGGRKFLDYEKLSSEAFYFGYGTCSDPKARPDTADRFLAYSYPLERTNESSGACSQI